MLLCAVGRYISERPCVYARLLYKNKSQPNGVIAAFCESSFACFKLALTPSKHCNSGIGTLQIIIFQVRFAKLHQNSSLFQTYFGWLAKNDKTRDGSCNINSAQDSSPFQLAYVHKFILLCMRDEHILEHSS